MTDEQEKVIERCKAMLKRAFPDLKGHLEFHLIPREDEVQTKYVENR